MLLPPTDDFCMGTELECLTCVPDDPDRVPQAVHRLLEILRELAPSLPGPTGIFNAYGRIYPDCGHIELAISEGHSPYVVPLLVERQQLLVREARSRLAAEQNIQLLLACNNHSGLLERGSPVWGAHENHTIPLHPKRFTQQILPFLVTRIFAGAGGIESPTGNYLAAVRPLCMEHAEGGSTTHDRSIHSTCREEHHMGARPRRFRYHSILGDGHRSQFNTSLQFGATALAIKAVCHDRQLKQELARMKTWDSCDWVGMLNQFNVLQQPGGDLQIHHRVLETQRVYLNAARRYAEMLDEPPGWIHETLQDWEDTLSAMETLDRPWLAARLDTFAKYEFYSAVLDDEELSWTELPKRPSFFPELALLDHSYHDFCSEDSVFSLLERDGLLSHRVGPFVLPGQEPDPFVPELATRALARARFIRFHADDDGRYLMDWSGVFDRQQGLVAAIHDPGATEYSEWENYRGPKVNDPESRMDRPHLRRVLESNAEHVDHAGAIGRLLRRLEEREQRDQQETESPR